MKTTISLLLCAVWLVGGTAAAVLVAAAYRGDGSCVVAQANPPLRFDLASGSNVLWRTALPNWGLGSPVVAGNRVFVMSEPDRDHDFPVLVCLDADSGQLLWQREIASQVDEPTRQAWHEHLVALRNLYRMRHLYAAATNKEATVATLAAHGCALNAKGAVSWQGDGSKRGDRRDVQLAGIFNRGGLYFDPWHLGGLGRIGYAYPTPVTDGERVYVATGLHAFACYDLAGRLLWQATVRGQGTSNAGYGGDDFCKNARSPLLYGDLFISDVGNLVRAFDKRTGKLLWSDKHTGHEIVSPVLVRAGGKDLLLTATLAAYGLPTGRKVAVEGWRNHGGTMLVKSDEPDVVFFTGGGEHGGWENKGQPPCPHPPPAAVRFGWRDDKLLATVLWSGIDGRSSGECHAGLVYHAGKLYHPHGVILEALTGKVLAGSARDRRQRATPQTRHLLWIAGSRVYGLSQSNGVGVCEVYDLAGTKLASSLLPVPTAEGERQERIIETVGHPSWGFSYGCPFVVAGDRLYIRSHGELICVGSR